MLARVERQPLVVHQEERARTLDHGSRFGEVEGHDRNLLVLDVAPDVELGPVGERKDAQALAGMLARVVQAPDLRPLVLRIPPLVRVAE